MSSGIKIFSGRATKSLAEKIALSYGKNLGNVIVTEFSDGEFEPSFEETVRGQDVFLIQSTMPPTENLFELLLMIDAAKRASAKSVTAVIPYFGFARQDRKSKPRVPIGAKMVANMLRSTGVDRIMTMDLHADQIQGFFEVPVDHLYASTIFLPYLQQIDTGNLIMAAPDAGGAKRANSYAKKLNIGLAMCHKQRKVANEVAEMTVIGDVKGKDVILVDDMVDTAGTLTKAADLFMQNGATSVRAFCTHAVLSGPALERIEKSSLTELIVTDSIPLNGKESSKIKVLSVAQLYAEVMKSMVNHESISSHFIIS
ncbi:ribose-phosphate pyrophosphokinase [Putridiphycobacter roseus]|uniref:Ribose-phosphate pyrophosphokinase n=1 Tax=Putridiphycobacter roseus TaxID=2219161 RepID=A0A2W1NKU2_9FLAO|nr:ribose-phosphate pyrophosphokinase [Putridiphycobacter roseus]PZE16282.1 ribose-phosphate pyrophosphokinase [Putridiphycobacter roseus]